MIRLATCLCAIIAGIPLHAQAERPRCWQIDATTQPLVPTSLRVWQKVPHAVVACPVYKGSGQLLWWIITLNLDITQDYWWDDPILFPLEPDGTRQRHSPKPAIVNGKGDVIGHLSACYPTCGAPSRTDIYLSHWVHGFPNRVSISVWNDGVLGSFKAPPLQWNAKTGAYDQIGVGQYDLPIPTKQP